MRACLDRTKLALGTLFACGFASAAAAGGAGAGYISQIYSVPASGVVLFVDSTNHTSPPTCEASSSPNRYALDVSTSAGQAALTVLMTAYAHHNQIVVSGTGSCSVWGDAETVQWLYIQS